MLQLQCMSQVEAVAAVLRVTLHRLHTSRAHAQKCERAWLIQMNHNMKDQTFIFTLYLNLYCTRPVPSRPNTTLTPSALHGCWTQGGAHQTSLFCACANASCCIMPPCHCLTVPPAFRTATMIHCHSFSSAQFSLLPALFIAHAMQNPHPPVAAVGWPEALPHDP